MPTAGAAAEGAEARPYPAEGPATTAGAPQPRCRGAIDAEVRHRIGRNLRLLYADILAEPLPERFETLLTDLATRRETS